MPTNPRSYDYLLFLIDRIPRWLNNISLIKCDCICPDRQYLDSRIAPDPDAPLQAISFATMATATTATTTDTSTMSRPTMFMNIERAQAIENIRRKRRSSSIHSIHNSTQIKYRMPDGLIVEYDAQAQKVLLDIVNDIGRGRNLIRRARAQARTQSFCKRGSQQAEESDQEADEDLDDDTVMTQVRLRRKRTNEASSCGDEAIGNLQTCEHSDAHLGKAQDLCAAAAYQLLRDGECRSEIKGAVEELEDAFARVQQALIVLEEKGSNSPLAPSSFERSMHMASRPQKVACAPLPSIRVEDEVDES